MIGWLRFRKTMLNLVARVDIKSNKPYYVMLSRLLPLSSDSVFQILSCMIEKVHAFNILIKNNSQV